MFASVMPPFIACARACAIEVSGVTTTPVVFEPAMMVGMTAVITSPAPIVIVAFDASSVYVPPVICSMTPPE